MKYIEEPNIVEMCLREHSKMSAHAFRSGGGLRVVSIGDTQKFYGEAPTFQEAIRILSDDIKASGRKYGDVYGLLEPHYLTGQSEPEGELDKWLLVGNSLDFGFDYVTNTFWFELTGYKELRTPLDIVDKVIEHGIEIDWSDSRGVALKSYPSRFPNGEKSCATKVVSKPESITDHRVWIWRAKRRASGIDLNAAAQAAFDAPHIVIED